MIIKKTPAKEYGERYGFPAPAIISRIKAGILDGVQENGEWYVVQIKPGKRERNSASDPNVPTVKQLLRKRFAPRYDEVALFAMSAAFGLLLLISPYMRAQLYAYAVLTRDARVYLIAFFFFSGLVLSIYHALVEKEKSDLDRTTMLFFAVFANALSAIVAGIHLLNQSEGWLLIFPIWNLLNGLTLLLFYRFDVIDDSCLVEGEATPLQVRIGFVAVALIVSGCYFILEWHWTTVFSASVVYATSLSRVVDRLLLQGRRENVRITSAST